MYALAYKLKRTDDSVWILSAKYGLLSPTQLVRPYDLKLSSLSKQERAAWSRSAQQALSYLEVDEVAFLCGRSYSDGLSGVSLLPPGLGIGKQLKLVKQWSAQLHHKLL